MSEFDRLTEGFEHSEKTEQNEQDDPLPPDIETVWGGGKRDGAGALAADTARTLIRAWGIDAFRTSKLHQMAVMEAERQSELEPLRKNYLKRKQM